MLLSEAKQILKKNGYKMNESIRRYVSWFDIQDENNEDLEEYLYTEFDEMFPGCNVEISEGSRDSSLIVSVVGMKPFTVNDVFKASEIKGKIINFVINNDY